MVYEDYAKNRAAGLHAYLAVALIHLIMNQNIGLLFLLVTFY